MSRIEIRFTPENLVRHLKHDPDKITTTRGRFHGNIGDYTHIGLDTYVLTKYFTLDMRYLPRYKHLHEDEGFPSKEAFYDEIHRIYGKNPYTTLVVHEFTRVIPTDVFIEVN